MEGDIPHPTEQNRRECLVRIYYHSTMLGSELLFPETGWVNHRNAAVDLGFAWRGSTNFGKGNKSVS